MSASRDDRSDPAVQAGPEGGEFDRSAAITRSLLGWGVVVGVFYLVTGIVQGVMRDGFEFSRHPLSLLMHGDTGWIQTVNLIVSGVMVLAASVGFARATEGSKGGRAGAILLGIFGLSLIGSGAFPPDPVSGFPPGTADPQATTAGILHLAFGGIGFVALAAATFVMAGWSARRGDGGDAALSRLSGALILIGFAGGAALATQTMGVVLLWIAVVVGWAWIAFMSVRLYRSVPHPDADRRPTPGTMA